MTAACLTLALATACTGGPASTGQSQGQPTSAVGPASGSPALAATKPSPTGPAGGTAQGSDGGGRPAGSTSPAAAAPNRGTAIPAAATATARSPSPPLGAAVSPSPIAANTPSPIAAGESSIGAPAPSGGMFRCDPTKPDALGPFYQPNAPVRNSVGRGYVLQGQVMTAQTCKPVPGAQIEFWLANDRGEYDDDHRATVIATEQAEYRFESNAPPPYAGRPPHIHIRVTAPGYRELVTQHYPKAGETSAALRLVLVPS